MKNKKILCLLLAAVLLTAGAVWVWLSAQIGRAHV